MVTFGAMSREVCTAKRDVTTTPLQSLVLLNDPQFVEAARVLAEHAWQRFPGDGPARNRLAFRALIGRSPDTVEAAILERLFREEDAEFTSHPDAAAKLLAVGESKRDRALPANELAAMTSVVSAIMFRHRRKAGTDAVGADDRRTLRAPVSEDHAGGAQ